VSNRLKIISPRLLVADVRVNTCVSGSACQVFTLTEWNVLSIGILVTLCETEIDDEDVIFVLIVSSNQKVIWLNIPMDYPLFVDLLNSLNLFQII
jgi:hypothetical protein